MPFGQIILIRAAKAVMITAASCITAGLNADIALSGLRVMRAGEATRRYAVPVSLTCITATKPTV